MADQSFILAAIGSLQLGDNVRPVVRDTAFTELVANIAAHGILSPLRAERTADGLVLTFGHRRLEAAKAAGLKEVPVVVVDGPPSEGDRCIMQLSENIHRQDLKPMEFAEAVGALVSETNWSATDLAEHLHISVSRISRALALLEAPQAVRDAVRAEKLGADAAYQLTLIADPQRQTEAFQQALQGSITRDQIANVAKSSRRSASVSGTTHSAPELRLQPSKATACLDRARTVTVSAANLTLTTFIECLEDLLARARKSRGLELTTFTRMLRDQAKTAGSSAGSR